MMNMKLKHVLILSVSFCALVYFVDKHSSSSSSTSISPGIRSSQNIETPSSSNSQESSLNVNNETRDTKHSNASKNFDPKGPKLAALPIVDAPVDQDDTQSKVRTVNKVTDSDSLFETNSNQPSSIHVVMVLKDAVKNPKLQRKFDVTVASIFQHSR